MSHPITEVLVHIAAPAKVSDDADYRALARAYLNFEAGERTALLTRTSREPEPRAPPLSPQAGLVINSPNLSFGSAFGNLTSPRPPSKDVNETQSSWAAPPSVVQDSLPENSVTLSEFCSPTRILEHYISGLESSQSDLSPSLQRQAQRLAGSAHSGYAVPLQLAHQSASDGGHAYTGITSTRPAASFSSSYIEPSIPTSSLPSLPREEIDGRGVEARASSQQTTEARDTVIPLSPIVGSKRRSPTSPEPQSVIEETRIASSYPSEATNNLNEPLPPSRAGSEPPAKKTRSSPPSSSGKSLTRSSSDIGPRQKSAARNLDHLEIVSPAPLASLQDLEPVDMITETLANLADRVFLKERYRPQSQTRELRPFERGYWLLDCSSWSRSLKDDAWEFLSNYLGQGNVGWGISCKRDQAFTWIRLYCWGCVVGHMYLVLWLASKRRAKHIGMSWIAGDGKPIIVTGARPSSR